MAQSIDEKVNQCSIQVMKNSPISFKFEINRLGRGCEIVSPQGAFPSYGKSPNQFRYNYRMSYLADIIKTHIRTRLQVQSELERANQILKEAPQKLECADAEIQKAVQAAEILGEVEQVSQALYNTYPDLDVTQFGLPEAPDRPLDPDTNDVTDIHEETEEDTNEPDTREEE